MVQAWRQSHHRLLRGHLNRAVVTAKGVNQCEVVSVPGIVIVVGSVVKVLLAASSTALRRQPPYFGGFNQPSSTLTTASSRSTVSILRFDSLGCLRNRLFSLIGNLFHGLGTGVTAL